MKKTIHFKICSFLWVIIFLIAHISPIQGQNLLPHQQTPSLTLFAPILRGLNFDIQNPLEFQFFVETPKDQISPSILEIEKLMKYFLTALTTQEDRMWVNLSPVQPDKIIEEHFGTTEMGRDLLSQDYLLKQLASSLFNPDHRIGKMFWTRVYQSLQETFGTTDIPVHTFYKFWITPGKAKIYSQGKRAYILESHLKVQLEEDLQTALHHQSSIEEVTGFLEQKQVKDIVYKTILPILEQEINEGQDFQMLRQIYHGLILSAWFKRYLKNHLLSETFSEKNKNEGLGFEGENQDDIYQQYLSFYQQGASNLIKEEQDFFGETIARHYFSGGFDPKTLYVDSAEGVLEVTGTPENIGLQGKLISGQLKLHPISESSDSAQVTLREKLKQAPSITGLTDSRFGKVVHVKSFFDQLTFLEKILFTKNFIKKIPFKGTFAETYQLFTEKQSVVDQLILIDMQGEISGGSLLTARERHQRYLSDFWTYPRQEGKGSFFLQQMSEWLVHNDIFILSWVSTQQALGFYFKALTPLMEYQLDVKNQYEFKAFLRTMGYVDLEKQNRLLQEFQHRAVMVQEGIQRMYDHPGTYILRNQDQKGEMIFDTLPKSQSLFFRKKTGKYLSAWLSGNRDLQEQWFFRELTFSPTSHLSQLNSNGTENIVVDELEYALLPEKPVAQQERFSMLSLGGRLYRDVQPKEQEILSRHYGNPQGFWILSNEKRKETIQNMPTGNAREENRVHIGFSTMMNLDIMAKRKSLYGIIGDVNDNVLWYYQMIKNVLMDSRLMVLSLSEARHQFCHLLIQAFEKEGFFFLDIGSNPIERQAQLILLLNDETSWMGTDEGFNHIWNMFIENRISVLPLDVRDSSKFLVIASWLKKRKLQVDTIYTSNIDSYFSDEPWTLFNSFGGLKMNVERSWDRYETNLHLIGFKDSLLIRTNPALTGGYYQLEMRPLQQSLEREVKKFVPTRIRIEDKMDSIFPSKDKILENMQDLQIPQRGGVFVFDFPQAWQAFTLPFSFSKDLQKIQGSVVEKVLDRLRMDSRQHIAGTILTSPDGKWKYRSGINDLGYFVDVKEIWPIEVDFEYPILEKNLEEQVEMQVADLPFLSIWNEKVVLAVESFLYGDQNQKPCWIYVTKTDSGDFSFWVAPLEKLALVNQVTQEHLAEMIGVDNFTMLTRMAFLKLTEEEMESAMMRGEVLSANESTNDLGGIDFNPALLDWDIDELSQNVDFTEKDLAILKEQIASCSGLSFQIFSLQPVSDIQKVFF